MNGDPGQAWWDAYVVMNSQQVSYLSLPYSAGYDSDFASSLLFCMQNFLYGFSQYKTQVGLLPSGAGTRDSNGPTKS